MIKVLRLMEKMQVEQMNIRVSCFSLNSLSVRVPHNFSSRVCETHDPESVAGLKPMLKTRVFETSLVKRPYAKTFSRFLSSE